mgnify:CR=1 FL=1
MKTIELKLFALQESLNLVKMGLVDIKDGDYQIFELANKFYDFLIENSNKFGLKKSKDETEITKGKVFNSVERVKNIKPVTLPIVNAQNETQQLSIEEFIDFLLRKK